MWHFFGYFVRGECLGLWNCRISSMEAFSISLLAHYGIQAPGTVHSVKADST